MLNKRSLILVGGGGHCKSVIDVCLSSGIEIEGILDPYIELGSEILGIPVLGGDKDISKYTISNDFLISVGFITNSSLRRKIGAILQEERANIISVTSPNAYVSPTATIDKGTIVMHKVCVNVSTKIGANCIINTGADIEHDSIIGNFTHISTGAYINGNCIIGEDVFIGSGSIVKQGVQICNHVIVGGNSFVNRDIEEPGVYVGSPIKKIK